MKFFLACAFLLLTLTACATTARDHDAALDAWAKAAIAGDYVTAQQYSRDDAFIFGVWQANTEKMRKRTQPTSYTILAHEQRGQTGVYWIRMNGSQPSCTIVELDPAGMVSAHRGWAPNGMCNAPGASHAQR